MALLGKPKLRLILDRQSIRRNQDALIGAVNAESRTLLQELANAGVSTLSSLDTSAGHPMIGQNWTNTPIRELPGGGLETEIYNRVEGMTFYNRSGATGRRGPWAIGGESLLRILEGGAQPHTIEPRESATLAFNAEVGVKASDMAGTAITAKGVETAQFLGGGNTDTTIFAQRVSHPGFAGFGFLRTTRLELEMGLAERAEATARRIAMRLR